MERVHDNLDKNHGFLANFSNSLSPSQKLEPAGLMMTFPSYIDLRHCYQGHIFHVPAKLEDWIEAKQEPINEEEVAL